MKVHYALLAVCLLGCGPKVEENDPLSSSGSQTTLSAICPVVSDGALRNVDDIETMERVYVEVLSSELVIVRSATDFTLGPRLVKLHGITNAGISSSRKERGKQRLQQLAVSGYFAPADVNCTLTLPDGGQGSFGQLFTAQGESIAEKLLTEQLVAPAPAGEPCGGDELRACFDEVRSSAPEIFSPFTVQRILWKPVAEKDGNLVVLTDMFGANIFVNGEKLTDSGPGNGYGTQARGRRPGCGYGANARVEIFDAAGERVKIRGDSTLVISNPCARVELR